MSTIDDIKLALGSKIDLKITWIKNIYYDEKNLLENEKYLLVARENSNFSKLLYLRYFVTISYNR